MKERIVYDLIGIISKEFQNFIDKAKIRSGRHIIHKAGKVYGRLVVLFADVLDQRTVHDDVSLVLYSEAATAQPLLRWRAGPSAGLDSQPVRGRAQTGERNPKRVVCITVGVVHWVGQELRVQLSEDHALRLI